MAPLRLQIIVQPRALPSPSGPTPTLPEPTIKWLEICPENLTIQQLSERLEKRFFDRNHAALNIKILKYLDDLELFPDYRIGDIFEDINKVHAGDKSYSTVKVYRNPPTREELVDPRRFESLPPNSLARPIKRPLPPLFAEATHTISHDPVDHGHPPRGFLPVQSQARNKRQKVDAFDFQLYADSDRPIDSLEDRQEFSLRNTRVRPPTITQVEDSQKKRRSFEPPRPIVNTKVNEGSDPYGTPISSQTGLHDVDKPLGNEVVYIPDSPLSGVDPGIDDSPPRSTGQSLKRSRSPEIPTSNYSSSMSQELQSEVPSVAPVPPSNQRHRIQTSANKRPLESSPKTSMTAPPVSQEPAIESSKQAVIDGVTKTPPPKQKDDVIQPGRLRRPKPKPLKQTLNANPTRKILNGAKKTAPSVYDPIETSEGSTHERELLRSAKRSKTSAPHESPKSKAVQPGSGKLSSGARSLEPIAPLPVAIPPPSVVASTSHAPLRPSPNPKSIEAETPKASAHGTSKTTGHTTGGLRQQEVAQEQNVGAAMQSRNSSDFDSTSSPKENQKNHEHARRPLVTSERSEAAVTEVGRRSRSLNRVSASDVGDGSRGKSLKRQLEEAEEIKRKAQAEFDRIAALQICHTRLDEATQWYHRKKGD